MKRTLWLAAVVVLSSCARRPLVAPTTPPTSGETPKAEVTPHSLPLQVGTPPPRPPRWKLPDYKVPAPDLRMPDLPQLNLVPWQPPPLAPQFDRFEHWHWQSFTPDKRPPLTGHFEREFEGRPVFSKPTHSKAPIHLEVPTMNLRSVLDDYDAQQKAMREKYVPFPIPVTLPISF